MSKYEIEIRADLPSSGIRPADQYGPAGPIDVGDVVAFHSAKNVWMTRLQPGDSGPLESYELSSGGVFVVNNRGNVYWIDPTERSVLFVESRYHAFKTTPAAGRRILAFDFTDICCINKKGLSWRHDQVTRDDLAIDRLTEDDVVITGWRESPDNTISVRLSLEDGKILS